MIRPWKYGVTGGLVGLPALTWIAWLASGREVFTKAGKAREVAVRDELFGDLVTQTRFVPGPIFGHYIGLDLAIAVSLAALAVGTVLWWRARRGRRPPVQAAPRVSP
jgi:hypothetical protein